MPTVFQTGLPGVAHAHYNFPVRSVPRASKPVTRPPPYEAQAYEKTHKNILQDECRTREIFLIARAPPGMMPLTATPSPWRTNAASPPRLAALSADPGRDSPSQPAVTSVPHSPRDKNKHHVSLGPSLPAPPPPHGAQSDRPSSQLCTRVDGSSPSRPMRITEMYKPRAAPSRSARAFSTRSAPPRFLPTISQPSGAGEAPTSPAQDALAEALLASAGTAAQRAGGFVEAAAESALAQCEAAVDAVVQSRKGRPSRTAVVAAASQLSDTRAALHSLRTEVQASLAELQEQMAQDVRQAFGVAALRAALPLETPERRGSTQVQCK